jgi:competence protein ComEC
LLVAIVAVALLEMVARAQGAPRGELVVTALDVGQGDALLVDLPDGRAMMVDAGGLVGSPVDVGRRVVAPVLRQRRRRRIDVVVISHPHPDHYGGLEAALEGIEVGELWWPGLASTTHPDGELVRWVDGLRRRGTVVHQAADLCGAPLRFGSAEARVLAPCPRADPAETANDNSLVITLRFGDRVVLLMGDAERAAEERLLATHGHELRADLLKIGHHGSRTSTTPALVAAVRPSLAVISCGVRNRFGHPHAVTLATLARARVDVRRTDRGGALVWRTDGRGVSHHQLGSQTE